jgi:Lrp/AsnC family leucine-responsive transcriptional regulator
MSVEEEHVALPMNYIGKHGGHYVDFWPKLDDNCSELTHFNDMKQATLDNYDRRILAELQHDARQSVAQIARNVGLSKTPVAARIKKMEADGLITGYRALLSPLHLGLSHVSYIELRLSDTREAALRAFNTAVRAIPEVEECYMIAGGFDYLIKIRTHDMAAYRRVMAESLSSLPYVAATSTYVAMEAVVEATQVALE